MDSILAKAIEKWGEEAQQRQVIEECGELIVAINHYRRGKGTVEDVITEIADVSIMCEQMKLMFGENRVNAEIERKVNRLRERLGYVKKSKEMTIDVRKEVSNV